MSFITRNSWPWKTVFILKRPCPITVTSWCARWRPLVYSNVCSGAYHRKHQSSASLAFVRGIYREPVNSPARTKGQQRENVSIWWRHNALFLTGISCGTKWHQNLLLVLAHPRGRCCFTCTSLPERRGTSAYRRRHSLWLQLSGGEDLARRGHSTSGMCRNQHGARITGTLWLEPQIPGDRQRTSNTDLWYFLCCLPK